MGQLCIPAFAYDAGMVLRWSVRVQEFVRRVKEGVDMDEGSVVMGQVGMPSCGRVIEAGASALRALWITVPQCDRRTVGSCSDPSMSLRYLHVIIST